MEDGTKPSVRVRCGACTNRVRPPKYFRSCPICDLENREKNRETYWRRLFQLPGVEVCPIHNVFLEPSDIRLDPLSNRHKYFSAESARLVADNHPINPKDPAQVILARLTRDVEWLLRQEYLNLGLDVLHDTDQIDEASRQPDFPNIPGSRLIRPTVLRGIDHKKEMAATPMAFPI